MAELARQEEEARQKELERQRIEEARRKEEELIRAEEEAERKRLENIRLAEEELIRKEHEERERILNNERERLARSGIVIRDRKPEDDAGRFSPDPGRVNYQEESEAQVTKLDQDKLR